MAHDCSTDNISLHLKNIFASGELVQRISYRENTRNCRRGKKQTMFIVGCHYQCDIRQSVRATGSVTMNLDTIYAIQDRAETQGRFVF